MAQPFDSPNQLIRHARDEVSNATDIIAAFIRAQQYTKVIYVDPKTGEQIFRIKVTGPELPAKLSNIVKDAGGNLRDALDHATYSSAVILVGGEPADTGFPFAKDAAGVAGELASKRLSGNPPEIRPILAGFKPYEGGNDTLWALNQIRNPNTHRFIVPIGAAQTMGGLSIASGRINGGQIGYSHWDATTKEIEYMRLSRDSQVNHQVNAAINIVFEGIKTVAGKSLIPTLNLMADEAERVVRDIEIATGKILATRNP